MRLTGWLEDWVLRTNHDHAAQRRSCAYWPSLQDYFPAAFLTQAGFVVIDPLPFPLAERWIPWGTGTFLPASFGAAAAITYGDTYYLRPAFAHHLSLHVHELVHVAQYQHLGTGPFLRRYLYQLLRTGYRNAPLELMAYDLQRRFERESAPFDILTEVAQQLDAMTAPACTTPSRETPCH